MDVTLSEGEVVTMAIAPKKRSTGRPGIFATPVTWSSSVTGDGSGIVVNVAEDLLSARIRGRIAGTIGTLSLSATRLDGAELSETHNIVVTAPKSSRTRMPPDGSPPWYIVVLARHRDSP